MTITDHTPEVAELATPVAAETAAPVNSMAARRVVRYLGGLVLLAAAYYAAGRASLALQYTGPVAAIWLPVGVGAAALYLGGLRWWPGVLVGDLALADPAQPLGSALGTVAGNLADILAIAVVLELLLGPRGSLDRLEYVGAMVMAIAAGAAITATAAMLSLRAGAVIEPSEMPRFWRDWFLADAIGALVVIPLILAWAQPRSQPWHRRDVWEGALMIGAVLGLSAVAMSGHTPLVFIVFPALIWAALRCGQRGVTLAVAVAAGMVVGLTANDVGAFTEHASSALSTQLYIATAAVTTLCLAASVSERRRATLDLAESRLRIAAAGALERRRLEGELHDSAQNRLVALQIRLGLVKERTEQTDPALAASLDGFIDEAGTIGEDLRRIAHGLAPPGLESHGLAAALTSQAVYSAIPVALVAQDIGRSVPHIELAVYLCCLESIQNAAKHAGPDADVKVYLGRRGAELTFRVDDTGRGFDASKTTAGAGLTSIHERVETIGGQVEVLSTLRRGTTVAGVVPWPPRTVSGA